MNKKNDIGSLYIGKSLNIPFIITMCKTQFDAGINGFYVNDNSITETEKFKKSIFLDWTDLSQCNPFKLKHPTICFGIDQNDGFDFAWIGIYDVGCVKSKIYIYTNDKSTNVFINYFPSAEHVYQLILNKISHN